MTQKTDVQQRRYTWRLYPTADQAASLAYQAHLCIDLWNAFMEISEILREVRVWVFDKEAGGPLLFDLDGTLHTLSLFDVLQNRRKLRYRPSVHEIVRRRGGGSIFDPSSQETRTYLPSEYDIGYWVSKLRQEDPRWAELSTWTPRRVVASFSAAWKSYFSKLKTGGASDKGRPRYKSHRNPTLAIPHRCASGCVLNKSDRHQRSFLAGLKGITGDIWARGLLPAEVSKYTHADVRCVDGKWELSCAMDIANRRSGGVRTRPTVVRFGLVGEFAELNGEIITLDGLQRAQLLDDQRIRMQSEFDLRWPRGKHLTPEEKVERQEQRVEISRVYAHCARVRRNALHVWTKQVVDRASVLTIYNPNTRANTKSPRGNEKNWGASVEPVSLLNRTTLSFASSAAISMLVYKAEEIGIPVQVIDDAVPDITEGRDLVATSKTMRRARRIFKEETDVNVRGKISGVKGNPGYRAVDHA